MRRWIWLAAGVVIVGSLLALGASRVIGRRGSRPATVISVLTGWLGAWVLWSFAGGLARTYGLLVEYYSPAFAVIALLGAIFEYRAHMRAGRERGLAIFVGVQLAWLVLVLLQNGLLIAGW